MIEEHSKYWFGKSLGMVITIWKDSKILKFVSTKNTKGVGQVTSRKGRDSITVKPPKDIITYHKHMNRVDRGYQQRLMRKGFESIDHFKNCYNK